MLIICGILGIWPRMFFKMYFKCIDFLTQMQQELPTCIFTHVKRFFYAQIYLFQSLHFWHSISFIVIVIVKIKTETLFNIIIRQIRPRLHWNSTVFVSIINSIKRNKSMDVIILIWNIKCIIINIKCRKVIIMCNCLIRLPSIFNKNNKDYPTDRLTKDK